MSSSSSVTPFDVRVAIIREWEITPYFSCLFSSRGFALRYSLRYYLITLALANRSLWFSYLGWWPTSLSKITSWWLISPFSLTWRLRTRSFCFFRLAKVNIYHSLGWPWRRLSEKSKWIPLQISLPWEYLSTIWSISWAISFEVSSTSLTTGSTMNLIFFLFGWFLNIWMQVCNVRCIGDTNTTLKLISLTFDWLLSAYNIPISCSPGSYMVLSPLSASIYSECSPCAYSIS